MAITSRDLQVEKLSTMIVEKIVHRVIEPSSWDEFVASRKPLTGIYTIKDDDLPIMRDLKAFLNMVICVENMWEKMTAKYALMGASVAYKITIVQDAADLYQNFKIYRSTNSIVTHYLSYLKELGITVVIPAFINKLKQLKEVCTIENADIAFDFLMGQLIIAEQFQDNFIRKQQQKALQKDVVEKKEEQTEDFITTLAKKNDFYAKQYFGDEIYEKHFTVEGKKQNQIDYYPDNKKDTNVIKNTKLLMNGIVGIKKVLDDHEAFSQSGMYHKVVYHGPSLYVNLRKIYDSLSEFDYQAVIAEKSKPFTEELKQHLKKLNDLLEKLACIADQFELELRLKEGTLLKKINLIIDRNNRLMTELRIPTDFSKQKDVFCSSRVKSRRDNLLEIDAQIQRLEKFMKFRGYALMDIPYPINTDMQDYIKKYYDDICMDRQHLKTYQKYLVDATEVKRDLRAFMMSQLEQIANYCGATLHAELMSALYSRLKYFKKQRISVLNKTNAIVRYHEENPYENFKVSEIKELGQDAVIIKHLQTRLEEIKAEKEKLFSAAVKLKDVKVDPVEGKSYVIEKDIDRDKTTPRLFNQIVLSQEEYAFFSNTLEKFTANKTIPSTDDVNKEVGLSAKSVILLQEINEIVKLPVKKSVPA